MIPANVQKPAQPKRKPNRKALLILVIFFFVLLIALFLASPLSKVQSIEVVGNNQLSADEIRKTSGVQIGMNFWDVKPGAVDQQLKSRFLLIAKTDVEVHFPGKVVIAIAEKPVAAVLIQKGGIYYRLLSDGTVFDQVKSLNGTSLPLLLSNEKNLSVEVGKRIADLDVQKFCEQIVQADRSLLQEISDFNILKGQLWSAHTMENNLEIRFPPGNINTVLNVYAKFWKQQLENKHSGIIYIYGPDEAWYSPGPAKSSNTNSSNTNSSNVKPSAKE